MTIRKSRRNSPDRKGRLRPLTPLAPGHFHSVFQWARVRLRSAHPAKQIRQLSSHRENALEAQLAHVIGNQP
jgi:hypothetical protein